MDIPNVIQKLVLDYTERDSKIGFGKEKAPGFNDRKRPHIYNIGSFSIVESRELSQSQNQFFNYDRYTFGILNNQGFRF